MATRVHLNMIGAANQRESETVVSQVMPGDIGSLPLETRVQVTAELSIDEKTNFIIATWSLSPWGEAGWAAWRDQTNFQSAHHKPIIMVIILASSRQPYKTLGYTCSKSHFPEYGRISVLRMFTKLFFSENQAFHDTFGTGDTVAFYILMQCRFFNVYPCFLIEHSFW